jgi:hypothetical protein
MLLAKILEIFEAQKDYILASDHLSKDSDGSSSQQQQEPQLQNEEQESRNPAVGEVTSELGNIRKRRFMTGKKVLSLLESCNF